MGSRQITTFAEKGKGKGKEVYRNDTALMSIRYALRKARLLG